MYDALMNAASNLLEKADEVEKRTFRKPIVKDQSDQLPRNGRGSYRRRALEMFGAAAAISSVDEAPKLGELVEKMLKKKVDADGREVDGQWKRLRLGRAIRKVARLPDTAWR